LEPFVIYKSLREAIIYGGEKLIDIRIISDHLLSKD